MYVAKTEHTAADASWYRAMGAAMAEKLCFSLVPHFDEVVGAMQPYVTMPTNYDDRLIPRVRPVNIIEPRKCARLGKSMPPMEQMVLITQREHTFSLGGHYVYKDVWTRNGWLITAILPDGATCHVRKGQETGTVYLDLDTGVYVRLQDRCPEYKRYLGHGLDHVCN